MTYNSYSGYRKPRPKYQRIIPAYRFKQQSSGDGIVQDYVNDILRVIEDDMKQSLDNERTQSKTELATYFDVPGMNNNRAKMHIYFHILTALKKAGYVPRLEQIKLAPDREMVYLHVTWFTKEDTSHEDYMDKFVKFHTIRKKPEIEDASDEAPAKPISRRRRKIK